MEESGTLHSALHLLPHQAQFLVHWAMIDRKTEQCPFKFLGPKIFKNLYLIVWQPLGACQGGMTGAGVITQKQISR